jgi:hypothetical protein
VSLDTESSAAHNLRVSSRSDGTRPPRIPVPGWIMSLMLLCVAVAGALLVYAVANRLLLGGALAAGSLVSCARFFRKFERRRGG